MRALRLLAVAALSFGCDAADSTSQLEEALARLGAAFETGDEDRLRGLYPDGWALVALSGENWNSVTGAGLRRRLGALFRERAPVGWVERPRSIQRSEDGRLAILSAEWRSMEIGTDRPLHERLRVALTLSDDGWRIREIAVWARR